MTYAADFLTEVQSHIADASEADLRAICDQLLWVSTNGGSVHLFGNGASFAIASHLATDLTKTANVRAYCYSDTSWLSMAGNDWQFENWMAKTLQHYAVEDDLAIFISSSGMSANVLRGARTAGDLDLNIITLSGMSPANSLRQLGDINLWCSSTRYNTVEACHLIWLLSAVEQLANG